MTGPDVNEFVRKAEDVYVNRLRAVLEPEHTDDFVAIEPESGDYFLGKTLSEAIGAARRCHPDRLAHCDCHAHSNRHTHCNCHTHSNYHTHSDSNHTCLYFGKRQICFKRERMFCLECK